MSCHTNNVPDGSQTRSSHESTSFNVGDETIHDRTEQVVVDRDESRHEQTMLNEANMDFQIPGLPHSVVKQAESSRVRELVKKIENHPHRHALQQDLQQNKAYNPFSATARKMIQDVGNGELYELFETDPKTQCKACPSYWSEGIVYCTCGHLLKETVPNRGFIEYTLDLLSIPEYTMRKGRPPTEYSISDHEVSKKLIHLLRHGSLHRENDGAVQFWRIKENLQKHYLHCHHWSDDKWKKSMAGGGGNILKKQYCTDSSGTILYLRALQGHSGRNPIDPSLLDNVLIPNDFFEYIYHIGCAINLHSIMNSGLIREDKNLSKRQTVFFTSVDPMNKERKDPEKMTWKHRVLHGTSRKRGRNKTRCIGST